MPHRSSRGLRHPGTLVTLLFGLVALATKSAQTYTLPPALLVYAAGLFTLAAVFGDPAPIACRRSASLGR